MIIVNLSITTVMYLFREFIVSSSLSTCTISLFVLYYLLSEIFRLFDRLIYFKKFKIPSTKITDISYTELYKTTIFNNLSTLPVFYLYKKFFIDEGYVDFSPNISKYTLFMELCVYFVTYFGIFTTGHHLLHTKVLYKYHKKHHQTYGDKAITLHYMDKLDFFLESTLPFFASPILLTYFFGHSSYLAFIIAGTVGMVGSLIKHAGYNFGSIIDGTNHHGHHINKF
jgi:sterol desaturase/sphingolipid hydroxylase (fatty acid hydroxylase superfamily)